MSRYGRSIDGRDCIGPCTKRNDRTTHPLKLDVRYFPKNTCATYPFISEITGEYAFYDICKDPVKEKTKKDELDVIVPRMDYPIDYFINTFYNIKSFDDLIEWLNNNKKASIFTKLRLIKYTIQVYSNQVDVIDDILVSIFIEIIKKYLIADIYDNVHKYMKSDKDQIIISKKLNTTEKDKNKTHKINLLMTKFANKSYVYNFLDRWIKSYKNDGRDIEDGFINDIVKNIM